MIDREKVKECVLKWLEGKDYFLVDVTVEQDNKVIVEVDHRDGVWIDDCAELSDYIYAHINRDEEDYELEVGSAGLGQPFKVREQYFCHVGSPVEVLTNDGRKLSGILKEANGTGFVVTEHKKVKLPDAKRPKLMDVDTSFSYEEIKYTKYLISFR